VLSIIGVSPIILYYQNLRILTNMWNVDDPLLTGRIYNLSAQVLSQAFLEAAPSDQPKLTHPDKCQSRPRSNANPWSDPKGIWPPPKGSYSVSSWLWDLSDIYLLLLGQPYKFWKDLGCYIVERAKQVMEALLFRSFKKYLCPKGSV